MNLNPLTRFNERSWKTTPAKYAVRTVVVAVPFGFVVTLGGVAFVGGFAFAATIIAAHTAFTAEPQAWQAEREAGRVGNLNHALSVASAAVPVLIALIAWAFVL